MSLAGRTALITGGGRGIGKAIAERLAREGARVIVTGRTEADLAAVAGATGGLAIRMDVGDRASIEAGLAELRDRSERVDVLVNNAGVAESAPFDKTDDALWDHLMAVNVTGAFHLTRALVPPMVAAGWGRVVSVASNAGITGYAYSTAYCASKHALIGMTRAIAVEIARTPVTINAVCPGWVATRMVDEAVARIAEKTGRGAAAARASLEAMSPQRRMVEPAEVAHLVATLCAEEARSVHGQAIVIDGGQVMS
jgi:NAD(P)-dependent dehydrogenase (short-subunit alcohol dehydrogenase family)